MQHDFTTLTNQRIRKYADLRDLYRNPTKNAQDIRTLNHELSDIEAQIHNLDNDSLRKKGLEYSKTEGVYRTKGTLSLIKPLLAKRKTDTPLTKEEEKTLFHWDQSALLDSLSDNNWYNDRQVGFLTGNRELPVGSKELKSYLSKQRSKLSQNGSSVSFAYIMTPDEKDESQNHFVSMNIRNNNGALELEYLDSNGELMQEKERRAITKQLPGVSIFYRDHNGKRITESAAKSNKEQILRVQFDGHNCGMYSTEITNLMKHANGNETIIKDGLKNISKLDPNDVRNEHYERLKYVYDQRTHNQHFISNFAPIRATQDSDALTSDINDKEIENRNRKQMSLLLRQKINTLSNHPKILKDAEPLLSTKQNMVSQNSGLTR